MDANHSQPPDGWQGNSGQPQRGRHPAEHTLRETYDATLDEVLQQVGDLQSAGPPDTDPWLLALAITRLGRVRDKLGSIWCWLYPPDER